MAFWLLLTENDRRPLKKGGIWIMPRETTLVSTTLSAMMTRRSPRTRSQNAAAVVYQSESESGGNAGNASKRFKKSEKQPSETALSQYAEPP